MATGSCPGGFVSGDFVDCTYGMSMNPTQWNSNCTIKLEDPCSKYIRAKSTLISHSLSAADVVCLQSWPWQHLNTRKKLIN